MKKPVNKIHSNHLIVNPGAPLNRNLLVLAGESISCRALTHVPEDTQGHVAGGGLWGQCFGRIFIGLEVVITFHNILYTPEV